MPYWVIKGLLVSRGKDTNRISIFKPFVTFLSFFCSVSVCCLCGVNKRKKKEKGERCDNPARIRTFVQIKMESYGRKE